MARWATSDFLNDGLDSMAAAVDKVVVCSGTSAPADYAGVVAAALATGASTVTVAADGSDQKGTTSASTATTIDSGGIATHVAIVKSTATEKLWFVTTCTTQTLVQGGTIDIPSFVITVKQPTAP